MMKRTNDIFLSLLSITILSPFLLLIAILVKTTSEGTVFYSHRRIGRNEKCFQCHKFRTMKPESDNVVVTVGEYDPRVTKLGRFLRKYKIDEIPQLFNILKGEMSFVGPRPDIEDYKTHYTTHYPDFFKHRPGLTSPGTLNFIDEQDLYIGAEDPDKKYIYEILPEKVRIDRNYFEKNNFLQDTILMIKTLVIIITR
jgi:lipopolysaccharide/colanic/teichoic acid biosynthesis glycosyltransferase